LDRTERAILDALASYTEHDGQASTRTVEKLVGGKATSIRAALERLHEKGQIEHGVGDIQGLPRTTKWWRVRTSSQDWTTEDEAGLEPRPPHPRPPLYGG